VRINRRQLLPPAAPVDRATAAGRPSARAGLLDQGRAADPRPATVAATPGRPCGLLDRPARHIEVQTPHAGQSKSY